MLNIIRLSIVLLFVNIASAAEVCIDNECQAMTDERALLLLSNLNASKVPLGINTLTSDSTETVSERYETATEVVVVVTVRYFDAAGNLIDVQTHTFRFKKDALEPSK